MENKLIRNISEEDYKVGYANGMSAERERIIKLLEPLFDKAENAETRRLLVRGIALIKGENK